MNLNYNSKIHKYGPIHKTNYVVNAIRYLDSILLEYTLELWCKMSETFLNLEMKFIDKCRNFSHVVLWENASKAVKT